MRTTIEMDPEHRARLLEIAARRGEKGFSGIVAEAIETYLVEQDALRERQIEVRRLQGVISRDEAAAIEARIHELRESWR